MFNRLRVIQFATFRSPIAERSQMSPTEPGGIKPTPSARKIFAVVAIGTGLIGSLVWVVFLAWIVTRLAIQLHF